MSEAEIARLERDVLLLRRELNEWIDKSLAERAEIERLKEVIDTLKAQVERLLAKEGKRIEEACKPPIKSISQIYHQLLREQPNSNSNLLEKARKIYDLQPDLPENPFNERKDHE